MVNSDELSRRVTGIMGGARPVGTARVIVHGSGNVVVGGDIHLYQSPSAAGLESLVAALSALSADQLGRVDSFVASMRGEH